MTYTRGRLALLSMISLLALLTLWWIWALPNQTGRASPEELGPANVAQAPGKVPRAPGLQGEGRQREERPATGIGAKDAQQTNTPEAARMLAGRVLHAGQGVATAEVQLLSSYYRQLKDEVEPLATARTDAQGQFRLTYRTATLNPYSRFVLTARAEGYTPFEELVIYGKKSFANLELELCKSCEVHGVVIDSQAQPVKGADIYAGLARSRLAPQAGLVYRSVQPAKATSDKFGRFQMTVPSGKAWSVVATAQAGRCELFHAASAEQRVDLRLQLVKPKTRPMLKVWGYVRDQKGRLRPDAQVKLMEGRSWNLGSKPKQDGEPAQGAGSFEFRVQAGSHCTLFAEADDFEVMNHPLGRVLVDTGPVFLDLRPGLAIRGQLVGVDGKALADRIVKLAGDPILPTDQIPPVTLLSRFDKSRALTDAKGQFAFEGLAKQEYRLLYREDEAPYRVAMTKVLAGSHDVSLQLGVIQGPAAEIRGRLVDALSWAPIAGAQISASRVASYLLGSSGSYGVATAVTDAQGVFVLRGLEPAQYELGQSAPGYAPSRFAAQFYAAGKHVTQVLAYPERSLHLRVLDVLGHPVARARVYLIDRQGKALSISVGGGGSMSPVRTDDQGRVNMHRLPAQTFTLKVEATSWQESWKHTLALAPSQTQEIEVQLEIIPGGEARRLEVDLRDAEGKPLTLDEDCGVLLEDLRGRRFTRTPIRRDKQGRLTIMQGAPWRQRRVEGSTLPLSVPRLAFRVRLSVAGYQELVLQFAAGKQALSRRATLIRK